MRAKLLEYLLIAGAALAAFAGCLGGTWVFDDFALLSDPAVTSPSGWWQCWRLTQTRPLTWFTFWANYQAGGENPAGYHAVNLALHVAVALLVFEVMRRLLPEKAALIAAVLFAVHPILTEPVNYIFGRAILLAALFSLLSIRSWILERPYAAAGWFTLAMLAKEECAAIPVFLLLLDRSRGVKVHWRGLAAMLAIALALGLRVIWAISVTPVAGAGAKAGIGAAAYLAAQGVEILRYLRTLVIPWGFSVDYSSTPPARLAEIAAWACIGLLAMWASRSFKGLGPGFWFLAGLVLLAPSSSIFPAADLAADRRMYLPLICFAAGGAGPLARSRPPGRLIVVSLITTAFIAISLYYTSLWRDPVKLWRNAVQSAPEKVRPRLQLARALPPQPALTVLKQAESLAPNDAAVPAEQGRILLSLGRPAEALGVFGRALALDPGSAGAINNRGTALAALGQANAARADFERALQRDPCLFDARLNLARIGVRTPGVGCWNTPRQEEMLK